MTRLFQPGGGFLGEVNLGDFQNQLFSHVKTEDTQNQWDSVRKQCWAGSQGSPSSPIPAAHSSLDPEPMCSILGLSFPHPYKKPFQPANL